MSKKRGKPKKQIKHEIETVHLDADYGEAETTCCICYAEFLDPEDLQMHMSQVHVNSYIKESCGFCTSSFKSLEELTIHIRDEHLTSLSLCSYCYRTFIDSNELLVHQKLHLNNSAQEPHSCSNCKETFKYRKDLESHELQNHYDCGPGLFIHKCFSLLSGYLNLHIIAFLQSLDSDTVYICGSCNYTNPHAKSYIKHLKKAGCKSFVCDKCFKVFGKKKYLNQHVKSYRECMHSPNEKDLIISCTKCNQFIQKDVYSEHKKLCSVPKCQICLVTFDSLELFAAHQMENHKNSINVTTCKYCRKQYVGDATLQKHIERMHGKELHLYKYSCVECSYTYKHPKYLFTHFYSAHPDMKPFTCKICDKSFKQRKKFSIHIKVCHNSQGKVKISDDSHVYFTAESNDNENSNADISEDAVIEEIPNEAQVEQVDTVVLTADKDLTSAEESETNKKETTDPLTTRRKRKRIRKNSADSDDEPLTKKLNRKLPNWKNRKGQRLTVRHVSQDKKDFTCPKCKKYCYTFQNYKQHMSLHSKNISLTCIKCDATFKSEAELKQHETEYHSYSQLTETLKNVLEKRNKCQNNSIPLKEYVVSEKFRNTIKKVIFTESTESAVLTEVKTGLSKFLESFTPEVPKNKKEIKISTNVCIKTVHNPLPRAPKIKMHKFVPPPKIEKGVMPFKLAMPTKCKFPPTNNLPKATITVASSDYVSKFSPKLHFSEQKQAEQKSPEQPIPQDSGLVYVDHAYAHDTQDEYEVIEDQTPAIPEVAEEVMLAASEDTSKPKYTHKLVLPNIPECFSKVHIGHLLPEAPYYKIVNVTDLINKPAKKKEPEPEKVEEGPVTLPSGTKLVNVNPLEHLLKDTVVQNEKPKNTKIKDYSTAVAKALLKLESKTPASSVKKPKKVIQKKPKKLTQKSLQMLGYLSQNDSKDTTKKKATKNTKKTVKRVEEKTEMLIVGNQESSQEGDMELFEEYLEDFPSDEEILENIEPPVTDTIQEISEGCEDNTKLLSLPEL